MRHRALFLLLDTRYVKEEKLSLGLAEVLSFREDAVYGFSMSLQAASWDWLGRDELLCDDEL